jgi:hypothetical protein
MSFCVVELLDRWGSMSLQVVRIPLQIVVAYPRARHLRNYRVTTRNDARIYVKLTSALIINALVSEWIRSGSTSNLRALSPC